MGLLKQFWVMIVKQLYVESGYCLQWMSWRPVVPISVLEGRHDIVGGAMLMKEMIHPGLAENIAPDGGPGSDITWIEIIIQTNWLGARYWNHLAPSYCLVAIILQQWCHFLGPHRVQFFLLTRGGQTSFPLNFYAKIFTWPSGHIYSPIFY